MSLAVRGMVYDAGDQATAVAALFRGSVQVTEKEFNGFVEDIGLTEGMIGVGFIAIVPQAGLTDFEEGLERIHPCAFVFEVADGEVIPVGLRETYYPIKFFWSEVESPAWGYDAGSHPEYSKGIDRSLKSLRLSASEFHTLTGGNTGFSIFEPAFGPRGDLLGVVGVAMDLDAMTAAALPSEVHSHFEMAVHDMTGGAPGVLEGAWSESIHAANRTWRVDLTYHAHGSYFWGGLAFVELGLVTGSALAIAVLAISARLRQKREVEKMRSFDRQKDDFLATVSHELRTPLTSIVGFADALRTGSGDLSRADQVEMIDFIADEADAMEGIVQDLLVVARLQQGGTVPITCRAIDDLGAEARSPSKPLSSE